MDIYQTLSTLFLGGTFLIALLTYIRQYFMYIILKNFIKDVRI